MNIMGNRPPHCSLPVMMALRYCWPVSYAPLCLHLPAFRSFVSNKYATIWWKALRLPEPHPSSVSVRLCFERGRRSEFDPAVSQLCQVLEHKYDFLGKQEGTKIKTIAVSLFMGHWGRSEETNFSYCFDMYGLLVICFQHCNTECNQLIAVQRLSSLEIYHSQSSTTLIERKTFQVSISDMSP